MRETKIKDSTIKKCCADAYNSSCNDCTATEVECLQYLLEAASGEKEADNAGN